MSRENKIGFKMNNKTARETLAVLLQLKDERDFHPKFVYALAKITGNLREVVAAIEAGITSPVKGQEEYSTRRNELLQVVSDKDKNGKPITLGRGQYQITDWEAFHKKIAVLDKQYEDVLGRVKARNKKAEELLSADVEGFEPYMFDIKYLPISKGLCKISTEQMRYLLPFLQGDIDDIPDYVEAL